MNILKVDMREADAAAALDALRSRLAADGDVVSEAGRRRTQQVFGQPLTPRQVVKRICADVRRQGVEALLDYTAKLDNAELTVQTMRVSAEELANSHASVDKEFLATVRRIRDNIARFQTAILHEDVQMPLPEHGGWLRQRYVPLDRVGICVPGGAAAYPSTVLMTAVPAQIAGVRQIAVVAPPTPFGANNRHVLATCHELGIEEVYRVGGAQAVAALAYGVEGILTVDKIVGPGNLFVALAKQHVYGDVDIDSIAGPSEVVVVADRTTPAHWIAADLIAQAEHAPGSSVLITWEDGVMAAVEVAMDQQLQTLDRGELARESLEQFGALVRVADRDEAAELANRFAAEHLHLECADTEAMLAEIHHAGAIFIGSHAPVSLGDYAAGPSHVLPTSGTARFASGLSANDFLRAGSVIHVNEQGLGALANDAIRLANIEGLTAHAASVNARRIQL